VWHSASRDAAGWHGKPRALRRDNGEGRHAKGASGAQPRVESVRHNPLAPAAGSGGLEILTTIYIYIYICS
jgi:hypothetical protein